MSSTRWTRLRIVTPFLALLALLGSEAASYGQANPSAPQRSDTTVKTVSAPRHPGVAILISEISIGGAGATANEYIFTAISEVLPLRNGSVVITDRATSSSIFVRIYDAQGKYVRTLGRYGQGPGEYTAPSGIAELPDGRIIVRDGRGGKINVYPAAGQAQGEQLIAGNASGTATGTDYILVGPDGAIYLRVPARSAMGSPPGSAMGPTVPGGYARLRLDGSRIDTLFAPELPRIGPPQLEASNPGVGGRTTNVPFSPGTLSTFSALGYFVTARSDRYALDLRIPPTAGSGPRAPWKQGDPVTSIRYNFTPVPVSDAERADQRRFVEEGMRNFVPNWQWTGPDIPRTKPAFKTIRVALDGRIWVSVSTLSERFDPASEPAPSIGRSGGGSAVGGGPPGGGTTAPPPTRAPLSWREPVRYDVFDPDGTYQGAVSVPYNTTINAMRGDFAWGIARDADGVQSVHRFRIAWR